MPDLIEEFGLDAVGEMIYDTMKEMNCEIPRDVFDRLMRFEELRFALQTKWRDNAGFMECYLTSMLWNRLTVEKQEEVLNIMNNDLNGEIK